MKKSKFLVFALALAIMLVGAGYAAWSETVTITNNVETGNLSVALANGTVAVYPTVSATAVDGLTNRTATATASTDGDKNTATVTVTNLYPGARAVVDIPIANDGTIPVKIGASGVANNNSNTNLTITQTAPATIAFEGSGTIQCVIDVLDTAPENMTATFDVTADYIQFNQ